MFIFIIYLFKIKHIKTLSTYTAQTIGYGGIYNYRPVFQRFIVKEFIYYIKRNSVTVTVDNIKRAQIKRINKLFAIGSYFFPFPF